MTGHGEARIAAPAEGGEPPPTPGRWRRLAPVLALFVLAPWAAECSWGGFVVTDYPLVLIFLSPLYGGAALLVREAARRIGGGWPAIVLLAAAFGVAQAGLVDQSLFNTGFLDDTEFADFDTAAAQTRVPVLGFSVGQAFDYVGNHVALSVCAPIAIVESFVSPYRRHRPWLRWPGLLVVGALFLAGSLLIFTDSEDGRKGFVLAPAQLVFAVLVVLALVAAALLPRWRRDRPAPAPGRRAAPAPLWVGILVYAGHATAGLVPGWAGIGVRTVLTAGVVALVVGWSRRAGWDQRHVLAAWSAGLLSAASFAYAVPSYARASPVAALVSDVVISVIALALVGGAFLRLRRERR
ncbi:hypothetical protein [Micromonospora sp. NPDC002575]|uniref:hypothetical protein n=1 Tax=Micromonospora sp. NPDC002575 TaxID=3364222 RepID=UPI0036A4CE90